MFTKNFHLDLLFKILPLYFQRDLITKSGSFNLHVNYIFEIEILLSVHFWLWNRMCSMDRKTQFVKYYYWWDLITKSGSFNLHVNYIFEIEILLSVHFWLWNRMCSMDRKTQFVKYIFASLICTQYWSKTFCFPKLSHLFLFTFWADTSILSAGKTAEKGYFTQTAESFTQFTPGWRYHNFSLILEMATLGDRQDVAWLTKKTRSSRSTRTFPFFGAKSLN